MTSQHLHILFSQIAISGRSNACFQGVPLDDLICLSDYVFVGPSALDFTEHSKLRAVFWDEMNRHCDRYTDSEEKKTRRIDAAKFLLPAMLARVPSVEECVIWIRDIPSEILGLWQVCHFMGLQHVLPKLSFVKLPRYGINATEFATYLEKRQVLKPARIRDNAKAWTYFVQGKWNDIIAQHLPKSHVVLKALRRLAPRCDQGRLNVSELDALILSQIGSVPEIQQVKVLGNTSYELDWTGDMILLQRINEWLSVAPPLVSIDGEGHWHNMILKMTDLGRSFLDGGLEIPWSICPKMMIGGVELYSTQGSWAVDHSRFESDGFVWIEQAG